MKPYFFICVYLFLSSVVMAQYTVNTTFNTYQDLSNPTSLNQGAVWTNNSIYQIYFNFNFEINGQNYRGTTTSLSPVGYEITGTPGNQILKVEWKNAGFIVGGPMVNPADFISYQIWLFESDNHIEIRFGANQFNSATFGRTGGNDPTMSIKLFYDGCSNVLGLQGAANLPSYWFFNSCVPNYTFVDGSPNSGLTYVFNPTTFTGVDKLMENKINVYPNPTTSNLLVEGIPTSFGLKRLEIADVTGRTLLIEEYSKVIGEPISMNVEALPKGIYFLKLIGENKSVSTT